MGCCNADFKSKNGKKITFLKNSSTPNGEKEGIKANNELSQENIILNSSLSTIQKEY